MAKAGVESLWGMEKTRLPPFFALGFAAEDADSGDVFKKCLPTIFISGKPYALLYLRLHSKSDVQRETKYILCSPVRCSNVICPRHFVMWNDMLSPHYAGIKSAQFVGFQVTSAVYVREA